MSYYVLYGDKKIRIARGINVGRTGTKAPKWHIIELVDGTKLYPVHFKYNKVKVEWTLNLLFFLTYSEVIEQLALSRGVFMSLIAKGY